MNDNELLFSHPTFDRLTITLASPKSSGGARTARQALRRALRATATVDTKGWRVRPVALSDAPEFDLIPPRGHIISVAQAWELTYALRQQPAIQVAEPSFAVIQTLTPEPELEPVLPAAAPNGFHTNGGHAHALTDLDPLGVDWSPRLIDAPGAWQLLPLPNRSSRGKGIRVGHPDSGYRHHDELFSEPDGQPIRILTQAERDFFADDLHAIDDLGDHGLGTASVLMSSDQTGMIVGVAPEAELVPLRVTKPSLLNLGFAPVLASGTAPLRDAIRYASKQANCHVISISLGWFGNESLHRAIQEAVANHVIVCAAAGNYVRFVVWPASYREVVAVGGCNRQRLRWSGSSRGRAVGVSAPAQDVWVARVAKPGQSSVAQSSGTSFAVASVAGVAALWLGFHGRELLIDKYDGHATLTDVFRWVLGQSCDQFAEETNGQFGVGIVNARRVLETPLPSIQQLHESMPAAAVMVEDTSPLQNIYLAFEDVPEAQVRQAVATILGVDESQLDAHLDAVGDELLFHLLTDPALREQIYRGELVPAAAVAAEPQAGIAPTLNGNHQHSHLSGAGRFSKTLRTAIHAN